jgi:hypothetical protein
MWEHELFHLNIRIYYFISLSGDEKTQQRKKGIQVDLGNTCGGEVSLLSKENNSTT